MVQASDAGTDIVNTAEVSSDQVATPVSATQTTPVGAPEINAIDDDFTNLPIPPGGLSPSIFSDDTLNSEGFDPSDVTVTILDDGGLTGVTVNPDGTLNIPAGAQSGTFVLEYQICDVNDPTNCDIATVTLVIAAPTQLFATKVANTSTTTTGSIVTYTITLRNDNAIPAIGVDIVDTPPLGFRFIEGSGVLNGDPVEPVFEDGNLVWADVDIAPGEAAVVNLSLVVGSGVTEGDFANITFAESESLGGTLVISNQAEAVVRIIADEIFDCSEVIGKVFKDLDGDGYQDQGEPGLPGVRVSTVKGLLITTDEYGRYHIACAATPREGIGSNFIVKLDERTLPDGYRVTTENPRVVRLTSGKLTSVDFGVSEARRVRVDLTADAFVSGSTQLQPQWVAEIDQLIEFLKQERSVLVLAYTGEGGRQRVHQVEQEVRSRWDERDYELEIDTKLFSSTATGER